MKYKCPCCGFYTFDEPLDNAFGDICPVCYWEIDAFVREEDKPSGANHGLSLRKCRDNYFEFGACTEEMLKYTRSPLGSELSADGKRIKFLETGIRGGCYGEFVKGKWDGKTHWSADYLYLDDDWFDLLRLYDIFCKVIEKYNRWGPNRITHGDWDKLYALAKERGDAAADLFDELAPWAEENFAEFEEFWILGV